MPARKDGNLVIRQGLPLRNYVLGSLHVLSDGVFPQQDSNARHLSSDVQRDDAGLFQLEDGS